MVNTTWDDPILPQSVVEAIRKAAQETGIDANLLMTLAWRESRFDPQVANRSSSADGLLQFTSGTWLQALHDFGAAHGAASYAAAIRKAPSGELTVSDERLRDAILKLRSDPVLSAAMAALLMERQRAAMSAWLGRSAKPADLYLLHVLGPSGTERFLTTLARHPSAPSTEVASGATLRNAGLLARDGRAMSVMGTYAAVRLMLANQRARSTAILAGSARPRVVEVGEAP